MTKARDIMTDMVVCVKKNTPMIEVAQLLALNDITGIPVVDDEMQPEGIISEKDVLDLFEVMQYVENRTVNSSMSHEVISCNAEDDLEKVCRCLQENTFRRVPVLEEGKVVGIVSRRDLILFMLKLRRKNETALV